MPRAFLLGCVTLRRGVISRERRCSQSEVDARFEKGSRLALLAEAALIVFLLTLYGYVVAAPVVNMVVMGISLAMKESKFASGPIDGVEHRTEGFERPRKIVVWSIIAWGWPLLLLCGLVLGNLLLLADLPSDRSRVEFWQDSIVWSFIPGWVLVFSAPLTILYLDRLRKAGIRYAEVYAFAAWVLTRVAWMMANVWLRSWQVEPDVWRADLPLGYFTFELSAAIAVAAIAAAVYFARRDESKFPPTAIAALALPTLVLYWVAGDIWAMFEGLFSVMLIGYAASRFMQQGGLMTAWLGPGRDALGSHASQYPGRRILPSLTSMSLVVLAISASAVLSVAASAIISSHDGATSTFAIIAIVLAVSLVFHALDRGRVGESLATKRSLSVAIVSLVVVTALMNEIWVVRDFELLDVDGWSLYGWQMAFMALIGCWKLMKSAILNDWYEITPFHIALVLPILGLLTLGPPRSAAALPGLSWHDWIEMSLIMALMLWAMWFVFGPEAKKASHHVEQGTPLTYAS